MGFLPASGFGAGAGGQMVQLIQDEADKRNALAAQQALEQQRIAIEQQDAQQRAQIQQAQLASINTDRQAKIQALADARAKDALGTLTPQTVLSPNAGILKMVQGTPYEGLFSPDKTLDARSILLNPQGGQTSEALPGQATGQIRYAGTPQQNELQSLNAARGRLIDAHPELGDMLGALDQKEVGPFLAQYMKEQTANKPEAVYNIGPGGTMRQIGTVAKGSHISNTPPTPQPPLITVQTVDENGNPVTKVVPKTAGSTFAKPLSGTEQLRNNQAQTVNDTGNDLIQKLSDPKVAALFGPGAGRFNSLQDFIGDPPPQYAELAGEIESYALANMGVHGMRSAQGAQQIKDLLSSKHTADAMIGAIKGLNSFSAEFVKNNQRKPGGGTTPSGSTPSAADLIKKYGG